MLDDNDVVNSNFRNQCPVIKIECEGVITTALIDTGCTTSVISEKLYEELKEKRADICSLPLAKSYIIGANKKRSAPITKQVMLDVTIGSSHYDIICLVAKELLYPFIIGMDFFERHKVIIDLGKKLITIQENDKIWLQYPEEECAHWIVGCIKGMYLTEYNTATVQNNENINTEQKAKLVKLLLQYKVVFEKPKAPVKDFEFEIELTDASPFKGYYTTIPEAHKAELDQLILSMCEDGVIEKAKISYLNPIVLVKKSNGKLRLF